MLDKILDAYDEETFITVSGFDKAIIGIDDMSLRLIYSVAKCVDILEETMTSDEAIEYLEYNVINSYIDDKGPIFCYDLF